MRIVVIADCVDLQSAGIHVYTRQMIESLQKLGKHDVVCIRQGLKPEVKFGNDIVVKGFFPFLMKDPSRIFFTIPWAIRKIKPDIVIEPAHFGPFNIPSNIGRVTVIHDLTPILFPKWHTYVSSLIQKLFLPSILRKTNLVIVNSQNTLRDLHTVYPFTIEKSACIYPGVDEFYQVAEAERVFEKQPFFMCTGTIEPRKNLETLLEAFRIFRETAVVNFKLILCGGKGWKSDSFYTKLAAHPFKNDIELRGYVSKNELKMLYSTTSGFIYPSLYEGFGFPVAEAMGCGAPCIVSNRSSLPEVGGDAAIYFDPNNASELASKMKELAVNKLQQAALSEQGIQQNRKFSWRTFAEKFEAELLKLNELKQ